VTLLTNAAFTSLDVAHNRVIGVRYDVDGREGVARTDFVGLTRGNSRGGQEIDDQEILEAVLELDNTE
jgi:hypothetical protein